MSFRFYILDNVRCDFTGTLIVVPDVGALNLPGAQAETSNRHKGEQSEGGRSYSER